jgi:glutaminase
MRREHSFICGDGGLGRSAARQRGRSAAATALAAILGLCASGVLCARGPIGARDADYQMAVSQAQQRYASDRAGQVSPALPPASAELYAIAIVRVDGKVHEAGDRKIPLLLTSIGAPFTAALLIQQGGESLNPGADRNAPLDAAGTLITLGLLQPRADEAAKWRAILANFGAFAGRELFLDERAYRSATAAQAAAREIARGLAAQHLLQDEADLVAELSVRQGAVSLTVRDLAAMAATLANDGVNPLNERRIVSAEVARTVRTLITNAGMRATGGWMRKLGMPAVAGPSGGIIALVPGRMGIAVYSPRLDAAGVSVRGQRALRYLSQALQVELFSDGLPP